MAKEAVMSHCGSHRFTQSVVVVEINNCMCVLAKLSITVVALPKEP